MPAIATGTQFKFANQICKDPAKLLSEFERLGLDPSLFEGKANSFILPRGKYPGRGWVLLCKSQVDLINVNAINHKLLIEFNAIRIEIRNLVVIHAECLTGGQEIDPNSIYLVEFADVRCLAHMAPINKSYNERYIDDLHIGGSSPNWYQSSLRAFTVQWTWETMLQDIWDKLPPLVFGANLNTDGVSYPVNNPENYNFRGVSAWEALHQVLDDIHHTLIPEPSTSGFNFKIIPLGVDSTETFQNQLKQAKPYIQSKSHDINPDVPLFPENVRVFFPNHNYNFQHADVFSNEYTPNDYWRQNPLYHIDVLTSSITGFANKSVIVGTILPIHESLPAIWKDDTALPTAFNHSTLSTRATEVATKLLNSIEYSKKRFHIIFSGLFAFAPSSVVAATSWYDTGEGVCTEILQSEFPPEKIVGPKLSLPSSIERALPPNISRINEPATRIIQGVIDSTSAEGSTDPSTAIILPGQSGSVSVQYGHYDGATSGTDIAWEGSIVWDHATPDRFHIIAFNETTRPIPLGAKVTLYYNWQVKRWIILGSNSIGSFSSAIGPTALSASSSGVALLLNSPTTFPSGYPTDITVNGSNELVFSRDGTYLIAVDTQLSYVSGSATADNNGTVILQLNGSTAKTGLFNVTFGAGGLGSTSLFYLGPFAANDTLRLRGSNAGADALSLSGTLVGIRLD